MSIDINLLKRLAKDEIFRHVENCHGEKDLIIDNSLVKPLERIINFSFLKERGVTKIYLLESNCISTSQNVIYIINSDVTSTRLIIDHVKNDISKNIIRNRSVLFFPGQNVITECIIESSGIWGDVIMDDLMLNFIPLESDVLSMEYPIAFKELYIEKTLLPLNNHARALLNFQALFGEIPLIYSIGEFSSKLVELWKNSFHGLLPSSGNIKPEAGTLIIIDRNIDPYTVCSSELTFEGLISDVFSIKSGFSQLESNSTRKTLLTDTTPLYKEIRDCLLTDVVQIVKDQIQQIQDSETKIKEISSVSDMKEFVSVEFRRIQVQKQNLNLFLEVCQELIKKKKLEHFEIRIDIEDNLRRSNYSNDIFKYIEWTIITQSDIYNTLKLMCLYSCCQQNSAWSKNKKYLMEIFLKSYGFNHLITFHNLDSSGFFTSHTNQPTQNFKSMSKDLKLIPDEKEKFKIDLSNIFSTKYRPLSAILIEHIISQQTTDIEITKHFDSQIKFHIFSDENKIPDNAKNTFAIFYLGGVCHSEISCMRLLSKKYNKNIFILTDSILNGSDIMKLHCDNLV